MFTTHGTFGNVHDIVFESSTLLHGEEKVAFGEAGYQDISNWGASVKMGENSLKWRKSVEISRDFLGIPLFENKWPGQTVANEFF